jgi:hypothetical protein
MERQIYSAIIVYCILKMYLKTYVKEIIVLLKNIDQLRQIIK